MIYEICDFWASRVQYENGYYVINNVIPPDEYHFGNNSVFTNVGCELAFNFAIEMGKLLNVATPPIWQTIANGIKKPFDPVRQIYLEYDGYVNATIKQADVVLLSYPFMYPMSPKVQQNDLVFYSAVTDPNGPAMTWSIYAIGYLDIGQYATAEKYFLQSYANIQPPFDVWTETPQGGTTNFITGAGGFLQGVAFGYGGVRIRDAGLFLYANSTLPSSVQSLKLKGINYLGNKVDITLLMNSFVVNLAYQNAANSLQITYTDNNQKVTKILQQNVPLTLPKVFSVIAQQQGNKK